MFYTERLNPKAITQERVAEPSVEKMRETGFAFASQRNDNLFAGANQMLSQAKNSYSNYTQSEEMNDELVKCTILLAQLDTYFRAGITDEDFRIIDDGDVADLRKLISVVNPDSFKAKERSLLNPTFGKASELIGGADADLVIDNTMIAIKTTSRSEFKRDHFNEIMGYYTLYKIRGIPDALVEPKIEDLGFYYSRYGELCTFPVAAVIVESKFSSFAQ